MGWGGLEGDNGICRGVRGRRIFTNVPGRGRWGFLHLLALCFDPIIVIRHDSVDEVALQLVVPHNRVFWSFFLLYLLLGYLALDFFNSLVDITHQVNPPGAF